MNSDSNNSSQSRAFIEEVRNRLINYILIGAAIGGFPLILVGLPRAFEFGFANIYYVLSFHALVVIIAVLRRRIPYLFRASFLLLIAFLAGLLSMSRWGLFGSYQIYLTLTIFLGVIFLGIRGGMVIAALTIISGTAIAFMVYHGVIVYDIDFAEFAVAPSSWLLAFSNVGLFSVMLLLCFGFMQRALTDTFRNLESRTRELEDASAAMKEEISKRIRLEDQLVQSQKMEAIGRLAGGIAHDFNNQLMVIINMSEELLHQIPEGDPRRLELGMIADAGDKSAELTRQLLAFSRKQVIEPAVVSLNDTLLELKRMLDRLIGEDIELDILLQENPWPVLIDPTQIEQVIINLSVNARDAMPRGGKILIETRNICLDQNYADSHFEVEPGDYFMLSVSDTGIGMDRETASHIFDPFFTTKDKGKGTGLGLAMVYGIIKQAGGNINVYSEPGSGTAFKIYLPRVLAEVEEKKTEPRGKTLLEGTKTLLLVEDEEVVRRSTALALSGHGYQIIEAASGEEALKIAGKESREIDLMITDVILTGINGKELAIEMKNSRPGMKILFISGYADNIITDHGVLEQDTPFLQKPFTMDVLIKKMREMLGN